MAEHSSKEGLALVLIVGVVAVVSMVMMAKGNATGYTVYGRQTENVIKPLPTKSYDDYEKPSLYSDEEMTTRYADCMSYINNEAYCACKSKGLGDCKDLFEVTNSGGINQPNEDPRYVTRYE
ncbi:hypothetical protein HYY69_07800 [Candidatus Woesearchaeota archaeon]|nr:hypothetical protein [Candidatus Woesearchaeota archaeon]